MPTKNRISWQTAKYGIFSELGCPGAIPIRQSLTNERLNFSEQRNGYLRFRRERYREAFLRVRDAFESAEWHVLRPTRSIDSNSAQFNALVHGLEQESQKVMAEEPKAEEAA